MKWNGSWQYPRELPAPKATLLPEGIPKSGLSPIKSPKSSIKVSWVLFCEDSISSERFSSIFLVRKKIGFSYPFSFSFVVRVGAQMKIRASFIDADWIFSAFILVYRSASFCFRIKRISKSVLFIFRKPNFVFAMYYLKLFNIFLIFSQL